MLAAAFGDGMIKNCQSCSLLLLLLEKGAVIPLHYATFISCFLPFCQFGMLGVFRKKGQVRVLWHAFAQVHHRALMASICSAALSTFQTGYFCRRAVLPRSRTR